MGLDNLSQSVWDRNIARRLSLGWAAGPTKSYSDVQGRAGLWVTARDGEGLWVIGEVHRII